MHIDPVPAHMAMRVCARDFHVSEYTTNINRKLRGFVEKSKGNVCVYLKIGKRQAAPKYHNGGKFQEKIRV